MKRKVKFEAYRQESLTKCRYQKDKYVGSYVCFNCNHYVSRGKFSSVICKFPLWLQLKRFIKSVIKKHKRTVRSMYASSSKVEEKVKAIKKVKRLKDLPKSKW